MRKSIYNFLNSCRTIYNFFCISIILLIYIVQYILYFSLVYFNAISLPFSSFSSSSLPFSPSCLLFLPPSVTLPCYSSFLPHYLLLLFFVPHSLPLLPRFILFSYLPSSFTSFLTLPKCSPACFLLG